jgi:hypothetical protein
VAQAGPTQVVVEVEPWMLPASASAEVSRKPTTATNAGVDAGEAGRWGHDDTPSDTSREH